MEEPLTFLLHGLKGRHEVRQRARERIPLYRLLWLLLRLRLRLRQSRRGTLHIELNAWGKLG